MKFLHRTCKVFFLLLVCIFGAQTVQAQEFASSKTQIEQIYDQIDFFTMLLAQRADFEVLEPAEVEESISQYFFVREGQDSVTTSFGAEPALLLIEVDGGVSQIRIEQNCSSNYVLFSSAINAQCVEEFWLVSPEANGGVITFEVPAYYAGDNAGKVMLSISACRFNGCSEEFTVSVAHKTVKEFSDNLTITNRHEYEYEYDDENYFVQEILFDFNGQDVLSLRASVNCTGPGFSSEPGEKDRISCSENKKISRSLLDYGQVDEFGNEFDLKLEFVVKIEDIDLLPEIKAQFKFADKTNRVTIVEHEIR